jgi:ABC-type thiamin/hydroxymethylpyrimidine transport system permease subunit
LIATGQSIIALTAGNSAAEHALLCGDAQFGTLPGMMSPRAVAQQARFTDIVGIVQIPFSTAGWIAALFQLPYGVLTEVAFAATRYRGKSFLFMGVAGALIGLVQLLIGYVPNGFAALAILAQAILIIVCAISGAAGGLLAKALADAVSRSGLLAGFGLTQRTEI